MIHDFYCEPCLVQSGHFFTFPKHVLRLGGGNVVKFSQFQKVGPCRAKQEGRITNVA